jgi:hypothetical protein
LEKKGVLLVLTPESKNNENFELCKGGEEFNLPMYCLRKDDISLDRFSHFSWRSIMCFSTEKEFDECIKRIREDLSFFYSTGR